MHSRGLIVSNFANMCRRLVSQREIVGDFISEFAVAGIDDSPDTTRFTVFGGRGEAALVTQIGPDGLAMQFPTGLLFI
jgi:hypothetical protein